jgi:hypothetical protein
MPSEKGLDRQLKAVYIGSNAMSLKRQTSRLARKAALAGFIYGVMICAPSAHAEVAIAAGGEYFHWKEATTPTVKEDGMRLAVDLSWFSSMEPGWSAGLNVRTYGGKVDYEGFFLFTGAPTTGTTDYRGTAGEIRIYHRLATQPFALMGAVGLDHWRRKLTSIQREDFDILYVRLGGEYNTTTKHGVMASAGVKYPIRRRENAHLQDIGFSQNPILKPRAAASLYATLGYRMSPTWDVIGYYDSFRFKASEAVDAGGGFSVFQPKSDMDVVGVKLQYNFQ